MFAQLKKHYDNLLTIFGQLQLGTAMIDMDGRITFLCQNCEHFLGKSQEEILGKHWDEVAPFKEEDAAQFRAMLASPRRQRIQVTMYVESSGRRHQIEVDIKDDPRDPRQKIVLFYDRSAESIRRHLPSKEEPFHGLVGRSESMRLVYQQIRDVAKTDTTVLIEGETGTGKELAARAIHFEGHRRNKPFIALNCAGLIDSLLGSQLFGHKRGAFTGAIADQLGVFETANGGTLFLDEISDIPMNVQTSLLRVLQEKEIMRIGESKPRKIDVRVLVATNRNLSDEVEKGNFRQDLLYRIRVARIQLPRLCERHTDIRSLVAFFLAQYRASMEIRALHVSHEAMGLLLKYGWPGNVRELKNAIEFAVIRCKSASIQPEDLPPEFMESFYPLGASKSRHEDDQRKLLLEALDQAGGNRSVAARLLGIGRSTLYRRLESLVSQMN